MVCVVGNEAWQLELDLLSTSASCPTCLFVHSGLAARTILYVFGLALGGGEEGTDCR